MSAPKLKKKWPKLKKPTIPTIYYAGKLGYSLQKPDGSYIPLTGEGTVGKHLRRAVPDLYRGDEGRAALDEELCRIREENFVNFIGEVAGHERGVHHCEDGNGRFLVQEGPRIIQGGSGDCPWLDKFFHDLLDDPDHPDQFPAFMSWLHQARKNLVLRKRRPLPTVIHVGPRNGGKSLCSEIVRQVLGGRAASALRALSGMTAFNSEVVAAELLVIDDEIGSRDHRARTQLAQGLKNYFFASSVRMEGKRVNAINLRPIQALIICVNSEPEHLQVLPQFDDSMRDKVSLMFCRKVGGLEDRMRNEEMIRKELPAFIAKLESFVIPPHLQDGRTGAAAFWHPHVVDLVNDIAPEEHLRQLLLQCKQVTMAIKEDGSWLGSSAEIESMLLENPVTKCSASRLLHWENACGSLLARLLGSSRCRIRRSDRNGQRRWKIFNLSKG